MKSERGITLIKLSLILVVVVFITSIIFYSFEKSTQISELEKFVLEMEKVQEKVNIIREKYVLWDGYDANESGNFYSYLQSLEFINANSSSNIYTEDFLKIINELNSKELECWNYNTDSILANYCYFTPDTLETLLDLKDVNLYVIINFHTGNVISKDGIKNVADTNEYIYRQYDTSIGNKLTVTNIQNSIKPTAEVVENYGLSEKIKISFPEDTISEIPNILEIYYFTSENDDNKKKCTDILDYKYVADERTAYFTIDKSGDYTFIVEDTNFIQYSKTEIQINLCNPPVLISGMQGIYWDEDGNEVEIENINDKNWYDYSSNNLKFANARSTDGNYWVWIPRYIYKETNEGVNINFTYENSLTSTKSKIATGYTIQSAFSEDEDIKGFWVAKFQCNIENKNYISILPGQTLTLANLSKAKSYCTKNETENLNNYSYLMSENEQKAILTLSEAFGITVSTNLENYSGGSGDKNGFFENTNYSSTGNIYGVYDLITSEVELTNNYTENKEGRFRPVLIIK